MRGEVIFKEKTSSILSSASTTGIGLFFMTWVELLAAENGRTALISSLESEYWLWVTSMIFLTIGAFYYFNQRN